MISPLFVAEVSSNHHRDLGRCLRFIERAAEIGCDAVKFQLFRIDRLFAPEILQHSEKHRRRRAWELPVEFLPAFTEACRNHQIALACTPFDLQAVEELFPYVDFYKISSYELLWEDLLRACGETAKPVVLSTGMATLGEVCRAVDVLRSSGCRDLTLLHCVSGYPTPPQECNLAAIRTLRKATNCPVGWSDHTVCPSVLYRAALRWEASMIEFHLDLEGRGDEFETGHCWLPHQIEEVISTLRAGIRSDGTGLKIPAPSELTDRDWRADPRDGLRPLQKTREDFVERIKERACLP